MCKYFIVFYFISYFSLQNSDVFLFLFCYYFTLFWFMHRGKSENALLKRSTYIYVTSLCTCAGFTGVFFLTDDTGEINRRITATPPTARESVTVLQSCRLLSADGGGGMRLTELTAVKSCLCLHHRHQQCS